MSACRNDLKGRCVNSLRPLCALRERIRNPKNRKGVILFLVYGHFKLIRIGGNSNEKRR